MIIPLNPVVQPIQGEKEPWIEPRNQQNDEIETSNHEKEHTENHQIPETPTTENKRTSTTPDQWKCIPFNRVTDELVAARSCRIRIPGRYIRDIQNGIGTADGRPGKSNLPQGIQIPESRMQIEGEQENTRQIEHAMAAAVSEIEAIDPQSLEEAMRRPDWKKWEAVIQEELGALKKAGTWGIVERPKGRNIVRNKWVFKIKKDAAGRIEQYKARLVAKGFTQVHGVDYYDTWAPVAKLASICLLLAIAAQNKWPINMFDFHSAFLNGQLDSDEEVFMEQPQGHEESDQKWYVCKLFKSLYGLKQAGRKWYDALCKALADIGFK